MSNLKKNWIDTTRKPRPGEVDGKDYHFVEKESMTDEVKAGKFIESATFSGNMYGKVQQVTKINNWNFAFKLGTSIKAVEDVVAEGKVCMLDIEMQGVKLVKNTSLNPKYVFIRPPSFEVLEQRLRGRGTEKEEAVLARLSAAKEEMDYASTPGAYDNIIVNDDLDKAYEALKKAIFI